MKSKSIVRAQSPSEKNEPMLFCRKLFSAVWIVAFLLCGVWGSGTSFAQTYRPTDPIASVAGEPVFLGELNYVLTEKLRVKDLDRIDVKVQQATAALLVRQHRAMKTLRRQGGESLQQILQRDWRAFESELQRTGGTVKDYCKKRSTDEVSLRHSREWETAWKSYLKSKMTEANLSRFFDSNRERYSAAKWDVSHIVLAVDRDQSGALEIASQRMNEISKTLADAAEESPPAEIRAVQSAFAKLAISDSDGATASSGGRIGWVSAPGDLPSSVMAAVRKTPENSVSEITRSPLGLHLVYVHEKSISDLALDDLTDQGQLRRDAANAMFEALVKGTGQLSGDQGSSPNGGGVVWFIKALRPPTGN